MAPPSAAGRGSWSGAAQTWPGPPPLTNTLSEACSFPEPFPQQTQTASPYPSNCPSAHPSTSRRSSGKGVRLILPFALPAPLLASRSPELSTEGQVLLVCFGMWSPGLQSHARILQASSAIYLTLAAAIPAPPTPTHTGLFSPTQGAQ